MTVSGAVVDCGLEISIGVSKLPITDSKAISCNSFVLRSFQVYVVEENIHLGNIEIIQRRQNTPIIRICLKT